MSYQVIARKYRPQVFDEVVGQRLITDTLKSAIQQGRVAHGYIFSGARGVGKTTTARILAKALNCAKGPAIVPCGECDSCREIAASNSVDVLEIDAASNRGIDEIRALRETVRYLPARDRYKVFIIDEVHMLTTEAFNALLKTLEEPPPRSLFILATTEPQKLPATIQSRCQHFSFRLLDYSEIVEQLQRITAAEKIQADEGALSAVALAAEGSLRDALSLLDQVIAACGERLDEAKVRQLLGVVPAETLQEILQAIGAGDSARVLEQVARLSSQGYELGHFAGEFTRFLRNLMVAKACGASSPLVQVPQAERRILADLSAQFGEEDLTRFFQILLRAESELRYSLDPRFHLELALVKLVHTRRLASLESVLTELRSQGAGSRPASERAAPAAPARGPSAKPSFSSAPAEMPRPPAPASSPTATAQVAVPRHEGPTPSAIVAAPVEDARLEAIKTLVFNQSKFLGSCLEPLVGWRFEDGEVRFLYSRKDSWAADALQSREQLEKLRAACTQVLGRPVKICVTLEEAARPSRTERPDARQRAEKDSGLEVFRRRFDCTLVDVKDLSQE
ncbi:MAG TPA: DNA polymerase III subunit gamma/tau [Terriglobia bacterium]|nr:DNA polymerase III subunit gamma/tau [Terriglobia bacterium]